MDLETAQTTTTAKLPILKQGEYDMRRLRIEQYFQVQDYCMGCHRESYLTTNADGTLTSLISGPVTADEKNQKKNDVNARSMLLMSLPNEHLLTFNQYKDAKTLFAAIETRFSGNEATKKTQKTLRNKPDLDTMSFDDLYNNFKIIEQEVKRTASSSSRSDNMAFVSSLSSTNEVNTAYGVSTANTQVSPPSTHVSTDSTQVSTANLSDATVYAFLANQPNESQLIHEDLVQIHDDDLEEMDLKWQLALLSMRTRRFFQKTSRKITINESDTAGYDKSKVECFNCHKLGYFARECRGARNQDSRNMNQDSSRRTVNVEGTSSKAMLAIDGAGFDWSYMADDEVPSNMTLMAFSNSENRNLANYKRGLTFVEEQLVFYKKNEVIFCEQLAVLKRDISYKDSEISMLKSELEKLKQEKERYQLKIEKFDNASKSLDKLIGSQIPDKSRKGLGFVSYNAVSPPPIGLFSPLNLDLSYSGLEEFQQPEFEGYGPKTSKNISEDIFNEVKESSNAPMVEELVLDDKLEKKTIFPTTAKIDFDRPKQQEKPTLKNLMEDMLPLGEEQKEEQLLVKELLKLLADESQVLLKVPRKNNMYSVDMKNIIPKESLTCLVAKATLDQSMLWHRRLGHNGVAERRNMTLIEAARTMLADSKLLTTFWAEAVNTACYVQNRILVDGKSDDGFFIGYSLNSKAFKVYNIRIRKVEENLHIRFLEDKPIVAYDGPKWLFDIDVLTKSMNYVPVVVGTNSNDFVGTKENIGSGQSSKETGSCQDYILMPLCKDCSLFDSSSKNASNDEPQPSSDAGEKDDESGNDDQEKPKNSAQDVNTAGSNINTTSINTGSLNINTASPTVITAPLEATHANFFGDETEVDMSNITNTYAVPFTPNTRIHKDHSLEQVIGNVQSGVQTRRMTNEQGFLVLFMKGKLMKTFILVYLLVSYLMKSQKVDLPYGKWEIGTKWVYRNKKDERGIMIRNKARLVAQGYTQEEGIDYDEVFAQVARIEAIRLFLAYAIFKKFVVYQMDVKSAFLYGKIKEEVYVCQSPRFDDPEFPDKVYKVEKALYGLHQALRAWSTRKEMCTEFEKMMHKKFQISSMGELTFFLGFTPMETSKPLLKDAEAEDVDIHLYRSIIGSLMYLTAS
ncbi:ribonuclease H-like domain-containing protein [Tanacetum coccineum]